MEIYGRTVQILTLAQDGLRFHLAGKQEEVRHSPGLRSTEDDSLRFLAAVVRDEIKPSGSSSLRNNLIVVESWTRPVAPPRRSPRFGFPDRC